MKIFLSGMESSYLRIWPNGQPMLWTLMSYYAMRKQEANSKAIIRDSMEIMVDSGAHSFQKGHRVEWEAYTEEYAAWIKENDSPKMVGYFEMDVDNIIGYEKVKQLRKILERVTDKVIPVWHITRGIDEYKRMCHEYSGRIISVTGFKNVEIRDEQYPMFYKYAHEAGCKVHCLGMTRRNVLDKVPFEYVDSSSWLHEAAYGAAPIDLADTGKSKTLKFPRGTSTYILQRKNYIAWRKMQEHYHAKWQGINHD